MHEGLSLSLSLSTPELIQRGKKSFLGDSTSVLIVFADGSDLRTHLNLC
jgi:hypothetical protein